MLGTSMAPRFGCCLFVSSRVSYRKDNRTRFSMALFEELEEVKHHINKTTRPQKAFLWLHHVFVSTSIMQFLLIAQDTRNHQHRSHRQALPQWPSSIIFKMTKLYFFQCNSKYIMASMHELCKRSSSRKGEVMINIHLHQATAWSFHQPSLFHQLSYLFNLAPSCIRSIQIAH